MNLRRSAIDLLAGLCLRSRGAGIAFGLCAALFPVFGQAQSIEWAQSAGGTLIDRASDIAVDPAGNSYVTGIFEGTATFGSFTLTNAGDRDIFVAKYDGDGNVLWVDSAGGTTSNDRGTAIAVDAAGNSYVTGQFEGTATFGPFTLTSTGENADLFVAKYDTNGSVLWAQSAGAALSDEGKGIGVDAAGNIYVTGDYCCGTLTFGAFTLAGGSHAVFVVKFDPSGNALWAQKSESTWIDWSDGIAVDAAGNSYVIGGYEKSTSFGTFTLTSAGDWDVFVAKYDPNGSVLWARSGGGTDREHVRGIGVDAAANSYITGTFRGTATFGPFTLTGAASGNMFVTKYDGSGSVLWARPGRWIGLDIAVQEGGISYVTGFSTGPPPSDPFNLAVYDSSGNLLWGDSAGVGGNGIAADAAGHIYVAGGFRGTATFDSLTLTSAGEDDIFVAKYGPGACCLADASCLQLGPSDCDDAGGTFVGGVCDGDADGDGVDAACGDPCPFDVADDSDGDGVCDSDDPCPNDNPDDTDGDGVCDSDDPCPLDNPDDTDGDGVCDSDDACPGFDDGADEDQDGVPDDCDGCPDDPAKTAPGVCGCSLPDEGDADGDGILDCVDQCPGVSDTLFAPECADAIPTISTWGLVVLTLLLLAIGKIYFRNRHVVSRE